MTIRSAAKALRDGEVSSVELARASIAAANALDADLGLYVTRFDEYALARAAAADADFAAGTDRGPLQGVPLTVKDNVAMAEGPTTAQSIVLDPSWGEGE